MSKPPSFLLPPGYALRRQAGPDYQTLAYMLTCQGASRYCQEYVVKVDAPIADLIDFAWSDFGEAFPDWCAAIAHMREPVHYFP